MKRLYVCAAIALGLILAGCARPAPMVLVSGAWARPGEQGMNSAIYLQLENGSRRDALLGAASDAAADVQLHRSEIDSDGNASMQAQDRIELAPQETLAFEPGGYHIMLMGLVRPLVPGDSIELILRFEKAGEIHVLVPVQTD